MIPRSTILKNFIIGKWTKVNGSYAYVTIAEIKASTRAEAKRIYKASR